MERYSEMKALKIMKFCLSARYDTHTYILIQASSSLLFPREPRWKFRKKPAATFLLFAECMQIKFTIVAACVSHERSLINRSLSLGLIETKLKAVLLALLVLLFR